MSDVTLYICLHGPHDGAVTSEKDKPRGYTKVVLQTEDQAEDGKRVVAYVHGPTYMAGSTTLRHLLYSRWLTFREEYDAAINFEG